MTHKINTFRRHFVKSRPSVLIASFIALVSATGVMAGDITKTSLTIYNDNLALVEEIRSLDLISGPNRLEFKNVSASIRAETVALAAQRELSYTFENPN